MHNPLKLLLILPLVLLVSCNQGGITMEKREYSEGGKVAEITCPVFEWDGTFCDTANAEIRKTIDSVLNNFLLYSTENSTFKMNTEIMYSDDRLISLVMEGECIKEDEVHSEKVRYAKTLDFKEGRFLNLSDFLEGDSWQQIADNLMKERVESGEDGYDALWETPTVSMLDKENFYIKDGKIVIFYPPYKLSYYNRGFVEFEFFKEDMRGYLTDYAKEHL